MSANGRPEGEHGSAQHEGSRAAREVTLDVRGMEPPEPLRLVLETISEFVPGDELRLLIDCQPKPLYRILERNGYVFEETPGTDAAFVVKIRRREPAPNS